MLRSECHRTNLNRARWLVCLLSAIVVLFASESLASFGRQSQLVVPIAPWGVSTIPLPTRIAVLRGGSTVEEEEEDEDEAEENEYDDEEYDSEQEENDEEEEERDDDKHVLKDDTSGVKMEVKVEKYDEPLVIPPLANLGASLVVMLFARKFDVFSPMVVKFARAAFIIYLIVHQAFLLWVRIQALKMNDRTPIELKSPLSSVLQSQLADAGGNKGMMKNIASSFLSSSSTVLEYDLKQVKSMQSGVIFNMMFMWVLHFKMGQVQPIMIQTITGLLQMVYSPLFQIYVMGRNLERPFKNPAMGRLMQEAEENTETSEAVETSVQVEEKDSSDDEDEMEEHDLEVDDQEEVKNEDAKADEDEEDEDQDTNGTEA